MGSQVEHLTVVFQLLRKHSLYANKKKCQFAKDKIEYLGHWASAKGVAVVKRNVILPKEFGSQ